ncbi:MAG: aldo/keto reductase [Fibrobacteres bacterium]|nr:aldo/keto reductase [Fibrobacterota bacterium]
MQYVQLGRTGLKVSRLTLGTMNFGPYATEAESFAMMDMALELGFNVFDTANVYGAKRGEGITESIVGRWLAQGGRRDRIVLATKVYGKMGDGPNDKGLSAYHIRRACEESLRRLKTDHIDLYQMHHVDRAVPWEEIWQAMQTLVQQGKVTYIGSSNFAAWHIAEANRVASGRGLLGLVSEQGLYNLKTRMAELEVLPACKGLGLGFFPWSPLSGGLLAGILQKVTAGSRRVTPAVQKELEKSKAQLERYENFCRELGESPADVGLAWVLANPAVTSPIIGPRTMEQLTGSLKALELKLSPETLEKLDGIWPGPGGGAPEAYAW